jgi:hypothetical protein
MRGNTHAVQYRTAAPLHQHEREAARELRKEAGREAVAMTLARISAALADRAASHRRPGRRLRFGPEWL